MSIPPQFSLWTEFYLKSKCGFYNKENVSKVHSTEKPGENYQEFLWRRIKEDA